MQDPSYRISTYCPQGMSPTLKTYLSQPIGEEMTTADVIAANLLGPFEDTDLPFACTFVGWTSENNEEQLENLFRKFNDLTVASSQQKISLEILTVTLNGGCLLVAGAYPLLDLNKEQIEDEYQNVSFILNRHVVEDMIGWIQGTMINGLLETDKIGIICTVLGDSEKLLDKKMAEILSLLQVTGLETSEKLNDLGIGIDDLHVSLAFYYSHRTGLQVYSLFFGDESHVFDETSALLKDVVRHNLNLLPTDEFDYQLEYVNTCTIHGLNGIYIKGDHFAGDNVRIIFTGQGAEGISGLIDCLFQDVEELDDECLFYEREQVRQQLLEYKSRAENNINQEFMNDLREYIGLILE